MSKPLDTVLTFVGPSTRLSCGQLSSRFQRDLYDRICEHLNPLVFLHPATSILGAMHGHIKGSQRNA